MCILMCMACALHVQVQHDLARFGQRLQRAMRKASAANFDRAGPLLLFAGGITSFSASQVAHANRAAPWTPSATRTEPHPGHPEPGPEP